MIQFQRTPFFFFFFLLSVKLRAHKLTTHLLTHPLRSGKTDTCRQKLGSPLRHWLINVLVTSKNKGGGKFRTSLQLLRVLMHVIRGYQAQKFDIVVGVELCHLLFCRMARPLKRSCEWQCTNCKHYAHRFPFSCRDHNWAIDCVSSWCGEASLGGLFHSSSFLHPL